MASVDGLFKTLLEKGADEIDISGLWNKSDTSGDGQVTESDFAAFVSQLSSKYDVTLDAAIAFKELDSNQSGSVDYSTFMMHAIIGADGQENDETDQASTIEWWKALGRGSLTPADSEWFNNIEVDWAPLPMSDGRPHFSHKTALALINSQALIVKSVVRKEPYCPPPGWKLLDLLHAHPNGIKLPGVKDVDSDKVLQGTAIENPDAVLIFIRGTILKGDVVADLKALPLSLDGFPGLIHRGFIGNYTRCPDLRSQLKASLARIMESTPSDKPIIFSGHSLGAALAVMAFWDAMELYPAAGARMILMTFGSPRVGTSAFAKAFDEKVTKTKSTAWRVANNADIVTHCGPKFVYKHCGEEIAFDLKLASNLKAWTKNHIDAYMAWFAQEMQK